MLLLQRQVPMAEDGGLEPQTSRSALLSKEACSHEQFIIHSEVRAEGGGLDPQPREGPHCFRGRPGP